MYKDGHIGISALLATPIVLTLLQFELYLIAGVFLLGVFFTTSLPDIDIKVGFLTHRGFTHTVYFGAIVGAVFALFATWLMIYTPLIDNAETLVETLSSTAGIGVDPSIGFEIPLAFGIGGFVGVIFHLFGDTVTPTGVNYWSSSSDYGTTIDLVNASNEKANERFFKIGMFVLIAGTIASFSLSGSTIYLIILGIIGVITLTALISYYTTLPTKYFRKLLLI